MKFNFGSTTSYNSIHPTYQYVEQFNNNNETYRNDTKWFGILLAFISGAFFTISSGLVKAIKNVDPMILLGIRSLLQIFVMLAICIIHGKNILGPKESRTLIHLQGMVGGMTLTLLYYSFRKLPLGDATTIIFSSPIIVIILSFLFLKEPCGILRIVVICTLFTGIVLVSKPPFLFQIHRSSEASYDVMGYICAIFATLFTALNIVIMRKCSDIHYSVLVANLSSWILLSAVTFFFIVSDVNHHSQMIPRDWITWGLIFLVAITGLTGQVLITKALEIEEAASLVLF
ncbi:hypothetical protein PV328_007780 [Microctonus aethiopoides]|uniref:EamA domain-containing protein n=1 Tax=Microctonus aethiopoides TaxID=144406 RepID=A0AA39EZW2_9HYME|nr:hypothetical protein PV328_007780 [Microctonus aethiopoides]